jgi:drug/metabolite transporter (DMT)-like permease
VSRQRIDWSVAVPFAIITLIWSSTWIVIRDQLGVVPPQWSVTYRFIIGAAAMALVARWNGQSLRIGRDGMMVAAGIGAMQFCINFNAVYIAEQFITSGLVATFFALLVIPASLLAWMFLGQKPSWNFASSSAVAIAGVTLLFSHELREHSHRTAEILAGLGLTLIGMIAAAGANVLQARPKVRDFPLLSLIAWSMAIGGALDALIALILTGPPVVEFRAGYWIGLLYLALAASALTFSLYYPVVRKIGPAKAAYSSVIIPIIAMALSTMFEGYRWTAMAAIGVALAVGGTAGALSRPRPVVAPPDAA